MHRFIFLFPAALVAAYVLFSRCSRPEYSEYIDTVAVPLERVLKKADIAPVAYFRNRVARKTQIFYKENNYRKAWLEKKGPNKRFKAFVSEVKESARYGLNPDDYDIAELEAAVDSVFDNRDRTDESISSLDIRITSAFFLFTTHLLEGRIRWPGAPDFIWRKEKVHEDDVTLLLARERASDLRKEIEMLHPDDPQYEKLRKALKDYKAVAARDVPAIRINRQLKPGDRDEAIPSIRRKLRLTDLAEDERVDDSLLYDAELANAIMKFQNRHGIPDDGTIDRETMSFLNVPLLRKAELIALNLERLRWRPHIEMRDEQIIINIPEYMLRLYDGNKVRMEMKVILGSEFNATPVFSDTLSFIVFSPTWNVPKSIFEEEFLPVLRHDPAHYSEDFRFFRNGEEIDPTEEDWEDDDLDVSAYRVVQNPGDLNALGHVKFVMPNNFNIYLHDTPADRLFRRDERALSHGCIRLEQPVDLAEYLLKGDDDWSRERIVRAMQSGEPQTVKLKKLLPVNIVYRTVWVDDMGRVNFRADIYGHDQRQLSQLKKAGDFEGVISVSE